MKQLLLQQLERDARGYYYALVNGTRLDVYRRRVEYAISELLKIGVSRDVINDILSDVALSIC